MSHVPSVTKLDHNQKSAYSRHLKEALTKSQMRETTRSPKSIPDETGVTRKTHSMDIPHVRKRGSPKQSCAGKM